MSENIDLSNTASPDLLDVICFSHLRWDFVFQRPQHLMTRFAAGGRVFYVEEPIWGGDTTRLDVSERGANLFVCVPHLAEGADEAALMPSLIDDLVGERADGNYVTWFYTPMMLEWASRLSPAAVIYDCMDELSGFKNAPPELIEREQNLFGMADLVFTGGQSLYEAKRHQHSSVHAFPSSIDTAHFSRALQINDEVPEQKDISRPRIGFAGVIDERLDTELLAEMAALRPDWSFVMVGPVVKISEEALPRRENIHYLGQKDYKNLPELMAGWDAAMMPFARNESTRYISPTKTPEYLAAGLPVASTAITDVVRPYGEMGLVQIGSTAEEFVAGLESAMNEDADERKSRAARFIGNLSWDKTFAGMSKLIGEVLRGTGRTSAKSAESSR